VRARTISDFTTNTVSVDNDESSEICSSRRETTAGKVAKAVSSRGRNAIPMGLFLGKNLVSVLDAVTSTVIDTGLASGLVLSLFTWEEMEIFASAENWNHEVDVISLELTNPPTL
jgi:DNA-binding beta-propeller fold protein YncE